MKIDTQLKDPDDTVIKEEIVGLVKDTILSDGAKSHTISDTKDKVEVNTWDHDHIAVQLPAGTNTNMSVAPIVTTASADQGTEVATVQVNTSLILDPSSAAAPIVVHDEAHKTLEEALIQVNTDLADIDKEIEKVRSYISELNRHSVDATDTKVRLNTLTSVKEDLLAEKESLESNHLVASNADNSVANENPGNIIPEKNVLTFNFDHFSENLGERDVSLTGSSAANSDKSVALDKFASLLREGNSNSENIIKTIEELEATEHVANPNKPNTSGGVSHDIAENRHIAGHMPDANNHIPLDEHEADMHAA